MRGLMRGSHAGRLRWLLTLESPGEGGGDAAVTWTVVANVWAEKRGLGGAELSGLEAETTYEFRMRYRTDVTPRWRLGLGTRKFGITSIADPDGSTRELVILAREIV